ncbi:hypothetical protein [Ramlibacter sp. AN1133]|uniref:hypothetical protein n=1 Tax=Ramlibacter sp. AN1133 TaxID=3133429 RepID=UPI0030C22716
MLRDPLAAGNGLVPGDSAAALPADRAGWLDLLSEELLAELPVEAWRKLFLGPGYESIRFVHETSTLLCCEAPTPEWSEDDVRTLAARFGGSVERYAQRVVVAFARPRAALEVAMLLQRTCTRRLRTALLTAPCVAACFEVEGESRRLTLGDAPGAARACADSAPPGSIHLCAATWRALGPAALEQQTQRALVTTEYQGDEVISAFITPAPPPRADLSTFAGLGLV